MNGREVFKHAVRRFPEVIIEGLEYNNLSLDEYGLWGLIFTTCSLISPLTSLGLGTSMSRFVSSDDKKLETQRC